MDYEEIIIELGLDREMDLKAAKILDKLIKKTDKKSLDIIKGRCVIVFGAGPSLTADIGKIKSEKLFEDCIMIAADGAVKALLEHNLIPSIQVTDLDGDVGSIIKANKLGVVTVVHAHGDNIEKIEEIVPQLKDVIGTTQVKPFGRLHNFGGFTDGDRAVYLAEQFRAGLIALAGMDFGSEVGRYSGSYDKKNKLRKLRIGRIILEELAVKSGTCIVNLTGRGENLREIPRVSAMQLRIISSQTP